MTIAAGQRIGHFELLVLDTTKKRATARCVCGRTRTLGVEALTLGIITSCGCMPPPLANRGAFREEQARQMRQRELSWARGKS